IIVGTRGHFRRTGSPISNTYLARDFSLGGPCMLSLRRASCAFALCCFAALSLCKPVAAKAAPPGQATQKPPVASSHAALSQPLTDAQPAANNTVLSGTVVDPSGASVTHAQ